MELMPWLKAIAKHWSWFNGVWWLETVGGKRMSGILGVENRTENCRTRAISCPSWSLGRMGISIRFSVSSVSRLFFKFLISNPFYPIRIFVRTIYIYGYLVPTASIPLSWFRTILFRLLFSLMIIRSSSPRCVYGKWGGPGNSDRWLSEGSAVSYLDITCAQNSAHWNYVRIVRRTQLTERVFYLHIPYETFGY